MGSKNLAPSPTANPPSPMPMPQPQAMSMGSPIDGGNFAINELPGNTSGPAAGGLPPGFDPAFFAQPMSGGPPPWQSMSGGGQVGQGGPAVGGKCPTCGK